MEGNKGNLQQQRQFAATKAIWTYVPVGGRDLRGELDQKVIGGGKEEKDPRDSWDHQEEAKNKESWDHQE